ncbi:MAG: RNA polymerase subunit sigma [Gallionellaceae bacterium CG1_02_56_997]|nr:MAG: RNA polymerase subunit sigma [Gallionellaceae bacterium CG1_02_56_997]PIU16670.1 MAG: RNA polymerase subunit sigma [Gallionellales bacterium CG08_land_8_20_14_0_20_59_87]
MTAKSKAEQGLLADTIFLTDIRRQMLKFATLQLSDASQAEDAVQEALIGAMKNADSFGGRAAFKTWMFAILKNKIADVLRYKQRTVNISSFAHEEDDEDMSELFDRKGHWQKDERPVAWGNPEASMREQEFWRVFEACLEHLPPKQARVFMMREFVELDAGEICATVELSTSNLHVLLHRARLRLRECIENNWYLQGEKS